MNKQRDYSKDKKPPRRKFRQETVVESFIVRPLAQEVVLLVWNTNITPNQITVTRIFLNILSLLFVLRADFMSFLIALVLFQTHEILDHADGMLARMKELSSKTGACIEAVSDTLFSTAHGFMGLIYACAAYKITGSLIYFILFSLSSIGYGLAVHFQRLTSFYTAGKEENFLIRNHDKEPYLSIIGVPFRESLENIFKTVIKWQNQFLLWGGFFYYLLIRFNINTLLVAFSVLVIVNNLYWVACLVRMVKKTFAKVTTGN